MLEGFMGLVANIKAMQLLIDDAEARKESALKKLGKEIIRQCTDIEEVSTVSFSLEDGWECPNSPIDHCVYVDEDYDHCIFCGHPEERK